MLNLEEGQTYIITKSDEPWWTVGKEYQAVLNKWGDLCLVDDDGDKWEVNYLNNRMSYKLELKEKEVERKYTPCDVNKIIIKAYQTYNNDAQRLAFIKGYFAK